MMKGDQMKLEWFIFGGMLGYLSAILVRHFNKEPVYETKKVSKLIEFDVDPQQVVINQANKQEMGLQVLASVNMEELLDLVARDGEKAAATYLGGQLIELMKVEGSLKDSVSLDKHFREVL